MTPETKIISGSLYYLADNIDSCVPIGELHGIIDSARLRQAAERLDTQTVQIMAMTAKKSEAVKLLTTCQRALNQIPNAKLNGQHKDTYALASEIDRWLKNEGEK